MTAVPIEPRGCLAPLDSSSRVLTVWTSHQAPHVLRSLLAEHLGYPEHLLRVISPDVGGGFGIKLHLYPEDLLVPFLTLRLGRPVKWVQTRNEDLRCNAHARDHLVTMQVAATKDGRLLGMRARIVMSAGAYSILPGFGTVLEATGAFRQILGPYRITNYEYEAVAVVSNKSPRGAYRGVAMVTTTFCMERMMDLLAERTGLDPCETRLRNLITEFPYVKALGVSYEPASFVESLRTGLRAVDYHGFRTRQAECRRVGRFLGVGLARDAEFTSLNSKIWR